MSEKLIVDAGPIGRARRGEAVAALGAAFWDYAETVHLLPSETRRRRVLPCYLAGDCADSQRFDTLLGASVDGAIVGAAAWLPPEAFPPDAKSQLIQIRLLVPALPWGIGAAREALRGQGENRRHHPPEPHYFLRAMGVVPDQQRRGIGRALIEPMVDRADEQGVGCYLSTVTFDHVAYFERFGFGVRSTYRATPTWPEVWAMWREPR